jgi:hypothetical protein
MAAKKYTTEPRINITPPLVPFFFKALRAIKIMPFITNPIKSVRAKLAPKIESTVHNVSDPENINGKKFSFNSRILSFILS